MMLVGGGFSRLKLTSWLEYLAGSDSRAAALRNRDSALAASLALSGQC
jgi:hypothetical protein